MRLVFAFLTDFATTLAKWIFIGALWLASVLLVTTNAFVMDAISDGMSSLLGVQTPYSKQKANLVRRKSSYCAGTSSNKNSKKIKGMGRSMIDRNVQDATMSPIPVIGGVASVGWAVSDVYAACEFIHLQNELDIAFGIDGDLTTFENVCSVSIQAVEGAREDAKQDLNSLEEQVRDMSESLGEFHEAMVEQAVDYMEQVERYLLRLGGG